MSRRDYARQYYAKTATRRRKLASDRRQCHRWCTWLLDELRTVGLLQPSLPNPSPNRAGLIAETPGPFVVRFPEIEARLRLGSSPIESGCWIFRSTNKKGYGVLSLGSGKREPAHRASYRCFRGDIPVGMLVCHTCDQRACWNPGHLFLGTHKDNMRDASLKGRLARPLSKIIALAQIREEMLTCWPIR